MNKKNILMVLPVLLIGLCSCNENSQDNVESKNESYKTQDIYEVVDFLLENDYESGALSNWTDFCLETSDYYTEIGDGEQDISRTSDRVDYAYAKEDEEGIVTGNSGYTKYFYDNYLSVHDTYYDGYNDIVYQMDNWDAIDNPDLRYSYEERTPTLDGDFLSLASLYFDDMVKSEIYPAVYTSEVYEQVQIEGYIEVTEEGLTHVYVSLYSLLTNVRYTLSLRDYDVNLTLDVIYDQDLNLVSLQYDYELSVSYLWSVGTPVEELDYTNASISISRYDDDISIPDWIGQVDLSNLDE